VTLTVQFIVPAPVFDTLNDVLPEDDVTSRCEGVTDRTGWAVVPACTMLSVIGLPVAPEAVTWTVPVRELVVALAS
ncbi:MAG: hypothetical protein NTZ09_03700, partial [Candidatus Hydrogenedentes bacterium]|nr:hypothetical protein [Candidatus Hydrogenedentota bacterium]